MNQESKISLVLTHYNRFPLLVESFHQVLSDPRIGEIVVCDDASTDGSFRRMEIAFRRHSKIKLFRNPKNLDCHRNKRQAMGHATLDWAVLFDSDNVLAPRYLDALYQLPRWEPDVVYCPDFAEPHFDYRAYAGSVVGRHNVHKFMIHRTFVTALNTCNFFVHRPSYLETWKNEVDPYTADSLYQNLNWLKSGRRLMIVAGLRYFHRVHQQSHYKLNWKKTGSLARVFEEQLRRLR